MRKRNRVILHLGIHKTGSSSIQDTLYHNLNRPIFARRKVRIINSLPANHSEFFQSSFSDRPDLYHTNKSKNLSMKEVEQTSKCIQERIIKEVAEFEDTTFILTGEDGCVLSKDGLEKLKTFINIAFGTDCVIKVVIFTRDPLSYVESAVQQNVKGNGLTIEQASELHIQKSSDRYILLFNRLEDIFDQDAIEFHSFESACSHKNGLVGYFLEKCFINHVNITIMKSNESISSEALFLLDNALKEHVKFTHVDVNILSKISGSRAHFLSDEQITIISSLSRNDLRFLEEKFGVVYRPINCYQNIKVLIQNGRFSNVLVENIDSFSLDFKNYLSRIISQLS